MKVYYEETWMDAQLFKDETLIEAEDELENHLPIKKGDQLTIVFAPKYHFYSMPWEMEDKEEIIIDIKGKKYDGISTFRTGSRNMKIWALSSAG